jgi:predicted HNH restriction endonuclease
MDGKTGLAITNIVDWKALGRFERNAKRLNKVSDEVEKAITDRGKDLARSEILSKIPLVAESFSEAEKKILEAATTYLALKRGAGSHAAYTLKQIKNRGLIGAAEASVTKSKSTAGFEGLDDAGLSHLSYERIILDHANEFSERAIAAAKKRLGIATPVSELAENEKTVRVRTANLLSWLRQRAATNDGLLPLFTNAEAAASIGIGNLATHGRPYGNIQSRIDYACFRLGLPALGLAAQAPFADAWDSGERDWSFPVELMQRGARGHAWSEEEFDALLELNDKLPGRSHVPWRAAIEEEELSVRNWAFTPVGEFAFNPQGGDEGGGKRPGKINWTRDELILALDLYMRNRTSPPGKSSNEVIELSGLLNRLGRILGLAENVDYRNANGVYMKMMNFRRFDPEFTSDGKVGLTRGNKDEAVVWSLYSDDVATLRSVAETIRASIEMGELPGQDGALDVEDQDDVEAEEGRLLTRVHRSRERSRKIVEKKKAAFLSQHGRLFCEACGFDFSLVYGSDHGHIIECHHIKPVHSMAAGDKTKLEDLVLLCANCHRVIHSNRKWISVGELISKIRGTKL